MQTGMLLLYSFEWMNGLLPVLIHSLSQSIVLLKWPWIVVVEMGARFEISTGVFFQASGVRNQADRKSSRERKVELIVGEDN